MNTSVSSDDIYRFLLTQEGRLRIKLGGSLATTVEIGHKAFMWPIGQVFSVRRQARPKYGRPLSNIIQPQFSGICFHVNCPNATDYCLNPVTLIGNCCPACVAVATFRATNVPNFWFVQKGLQQLESMYPSYLGISKIRLDTDALHPAYQLAIIPDKPENYDEDYFRKALDTALYTATNWYTAGNVQMFDIKIHVCTQKNRLSIGYIFKCILVALASLLFAIGLFVYEYKRNATLRFWITKLANRWRLNTEDLVFFSRGAVHLWREEEGQEEPASFENVMFKEGSSNKNKPSTKADEQSTSNEADYLSLNETETLV